MIMSTSMQEPGGCRVQKKEMGLHWNSVMKKNATQVKTVTVMAL